MSVLWMDVKSLVWIARGFVSVRKKTLGIEALGSCEMLMLWLNGVLFP